MWSCRLSQQQAQRGVKLTIPNIDGSEVQLSTKDQNVRHGDTRTISGAGMPRKGGGRGDLIVEFAVHQVPE